MEDSMVDGANVRVAGVFNFELVRDGVVIDRWESKNLVVDEGVNYMLNASLGGATQLTTWYVAIFEGNRTPAATDTAANFHSLYTECAAYDEATRPAYTPATSTAKSLTNNASKAVFTFNATKTIYGAALLSDNTKTGTAGKLAAASQFAASKNVSAGDTLNVGYTVNGAGS